MISCRLIKTIKAISDLSYDNLDLFLSVARQIELDKGVIILNEGQVCNELYFVEKGFLRTYINQEGKDNNVNFTLEGHFTTNLRSLKTNEPSQNVIVSGENSIVTFFPREKLLDFYYNINEIGYLCRRILGLLLLESDELINLHKIPSPEDRYHYIIRNKPQLIQRIPVSHLSSYIGVARETLSRIRKNMS